MPERPADTVLVVLRFSVPEEDGAAFLVQGRSVLELLSRQRGFVRGHLGRATDDVGRWVLSTEWDGVGAYRRAFSAYDVKVEATPLFNRAVEEPSAFEVLHRAGAGDQAGSASAESPLGSEAHHRPPAGWSHRGQQGNRP
jgi:heme-degrading monooxygenase HmoA